MKALAERKPVMFGIVSTIVIFALYALVSMGLYGLVAPLLGSTSGFLIGGAVRIVFAVLTIILLGFIIKGSGFKFTFSTQGFAKSMFAGIPILIYILTLTIPLFINISKINSAFISSIPANIFQQIATGIFEESLFRGLLMTALIVRFCDKLKGRFLTVYLCGLVFGLLHFGNAFTSGAGYGNISAALSTALGLALPGIAFAVVYLYSKNLLGCMILHALYDIISGMYSGLAAGTVNETVFQVTQSVSSLILLAMPLLVIPWIIKAKKVFVTTQPVRQSAGKV